MLPTVDSIVNRSLLVDCKSVIIDIISNDQLNMAIDQIENQPNIAIRLVNRLQSLSIRCQISVLSAIVRSFVRTLHIDSTPRMVICGITKLWRNIEGCIPRRLYQDTITQLIGSSVTHDDLCDDPLHILRCDPIVFRRPEHFQCLLRMISFYLSASRSHLYRRLALTSTTTNSDEMVERDDLARALIHTQESAIIQILLEICDDNSEENEWISREMNGIICSHIHDMFIADPMLSKLVHFQTYSLRLIPLTVRGIASMHICIDFVPELLAQPSIDKRIFAIVLIAELSQHYPIQSLYSRSQLVIDSLSTLLSTANIDECLEMFLSIVSALAKIANVFPPLSGDVASLLIRVGSIARCRIAFEYGKKKNSIEQQLIDRISNVFRMELCESVFIKTL